ncbi:hydroxyglutarate oxidase [Virgisporangium aliadipatigenens]|uniref:Hydroxyglutarate oxidase n=1 Tax=Virgisporangium aliadipatigenens TaxID=741659 RepID=A0A8J3YKZ1_9ACTN|nr:L-2-hydroxyglutarate oxidase [Virgisporangium aliadipatigenens]GIJ46337.1 hydroxyglutarate oxidase [Virgisporangium aliadipatigenens]
MLPNVVVGGGIVGLATARALQEREPDRPVVVLEKEATLAAHQTGRNSGVIHSGLYYAPGSLKATLAVRGAEAMKEWCAARGVPYDVPGKLVVATSPAELPRLQALRERGKRNGVPVREASPDEIREREPALRAVAGLVVESTGRVDYSRVCAVLGEELTAAGGTIRLSEAVSGIAARAGEVRLTTAKETFAAHRVAVCGGLQSDRLARMTGADPGVRIMPFRGEYRELVPEREHLVRGLVYPVPDPDLPFLGVHLTRGLDGHVHLGPNAVPAFAREGYRRRDISPRDLADSLRYPGAWRMARRYGRVGAGELLRSFVARSFVAAVRRMLPDVRAEDLRPAPAGVRAQAVGRDGRLVDDFLFRRTGAVLHVLNAPSPAATASLLIGRRIADELLTESD